MTNAVLDHFIAEARTLVGESSGTLRELEKQPGDAALIDATFRALHTLKGTSDLFRFAPLTQLVHVGEDLLEMVRSARLALTPETVDVLLASLDQVSHWLNDLETDGELPPDAANVAGPRIESLRAVIERAGRDAVPAGEADAGTPSADGSWLDGFSEAERLCALAHILKTGDTLRAVRFAPSATSLRAGEDPLRRVGEIPDRLVTRATPAAPWPSLAELDPFLCNLTFEVLTAASREALAERFGEVVDAAEIRVLRPEDLIRPAGDLADSAACETFADTALAVLRDGKDADALATVRGAAEALLARTPETAREATLLRPLILVLAGAPEAPSWLASLVAAIGNGAPVGWAPPTGAAVDDPAAADPFIPRENPDEALRSPAIDKSAAAPSEDDATPAASERSAEADGAASAGANPAPDQGSDAGSDAGSAGDCTQGDSEAGSPTDKASEIRPDNENVPATGVVAADDMNQRAEPAAEPVSTDAVAPAAAAPFAETDTVEGAVPGDSIEGPTGDLSAASGSPGVRPSEPSEGPVASSADAPESGPSTPVESLEGPAEGDPASRAQDGAAETPASGPGDTEPEAPATPPPADTAAAVTPDAPDPAQSAGIPSWAGDGKGEGATQPAGPRTEAVAPVPENSDAHNDTRSAIETEAVAEALTLPEVPPATAPSAPAPAGEGDLASDARDDTGQTEAEPERAAQVACTQAETETAPVAAAETANTQHEAATTEADAVNVDGDSQATAQLAKEAVEAPEQPPASASSEESPAEELVRDAAGTGTATSTRVEPDGESDGASAVSDAPEAGGTAGPDADDASSGRPSATQEGATEADAAPADQPAGPRPATAPSTAEDPAGTIAQAPGPDTAEEPGERDGEGAPSDDETKAEAKAAVTESESRNETDVVALLAPEPEQAPAEPGTTAPDDAALLQALEAPEVAVTEAAASGNFDAPDVGVATPAPAEPGEQAGGEGARDAAAQPHAPEFTSVEEQEAATSHDRGAAEAAEQPSDPAASTQQASAPGSERVEQAAAAIAEPETSPSDEIRTNGSDGTATDGEPVAPAAPPSEVSEAEEVGSVAAASVAPEAAGAGDPEAAASDDPETGGQGVPTHARQPSRDRGEEPAEVAAAPAALPSMAGVGGPGALPSHGDEATGAAEEAGEAAVCGEHTSGGVGGERVLEDAGVTVAEAADTAELEAIRPADVEAAATGGELARKRADVASGATRDGEAESAAEPVAPGSAEAAGAVPSGRPAMPRPRAVAGEAMHLDEQQITELVGQLVAARNKLPRLVHQAGDVLGCHDLARALRQHHAVVGRVVRALQGAVAGARMTPVAAAFARIPQLVEDLAQELGKRVELVLEGEATKADRAVVDQLDAPLLHLVRNALDHGIEMPDRRAAAGKPEVGTLRLTAFRENGRLIVEMVDDGAGIDIERVKAKAVERGLIEAERATELSEADAASLVFAPGLSTAETVSKLSGRGVGMDAVRSAVEKAGGSVSLFSDAGRGVRVRLEMPLSPARRRVMTVGCGGRLYGLEADNVCETVHAPRRNLHNAGEVEILIHGDAAIPVIRLADRLGLPRASDTPEDVAVVVLLVGGERVGIVVDDFREAVDVAVTPLEGRLSGVCGYAGTAHVGDGRVVLVLDMEELI